MAGGPAALAGLLPGDIILRFRGTLVEDDQALPWLIAAAPPGSRVPVEIVRGPSA
ncbi:MAG: PDZ domain-containing protein [bacterium]